MGIADERCDVCHGESGGHMVGVAAVPGVPLSVAWCNECLFHQAIPRFVVEGWLTIEYDMEGETMPDDPPPIEEALAEWVHGFFIWMGADRRYEPLKEVYEEVWRGIERIPDTTMP